jgi:heat shock protein 4
MNADEAVARGAALQSAILSPRFKVLPYEIAEAQLFPIELSWEGEEDNSVVMFDRGLTFPIVRRVTLKRQGAFQLKCSYHESSKQYGVDPQELCTFTIMAPPDELKKVRVNVKEDLHGIINLSSGQMVEEVVDGEEGGEEDHHEGEGDKKVKVKKTLLDFTTQRPLEWTVEEIQAQFEKEVQMANADRVVRETSDMRNELESYIYSMRDKIIADLAQYATEEERAAFSSALEQTENWLYEDGFDATKSVYAEKLAELQKSGNPIQIRQIESSTRPSAVSSLQRALEHYTQFVNDTSDATAHITDEERQVCHKTLDDISAWMYDMLDKQGNLPPHVSPVLTVSELQKKTQELNKVCSPIRNKPKPKPPKEEKKEEKKEEDTKMEDDGKEGAMETEDGGEKPQENGEEEPMEMD